MEEIRSKFELERSCLDIHTEYLSNEKGVPILDMYVCGCIISRCFYEPQYVSHLSYWNGAQVATRVIHMYGYLYLQWTSDDFAKLVQYNKTKPFIKPVILS